jgi:hypothetical protein
MLPRTPETEVWYSMREEVRPQVPKELRDSLRQSVKFVEGWTQDPRSSQAWSPAGAASGTAQERLRDLTSGKEAELRALVLRAVGEFVGLKQTFFVHDMSCTLQNLAHQAVRLTSRPSEATVQELLGAAINFTLQLAIELGRDPAEMRGLERLLIDGLSTAK